MEDSTGRSKRDTLVGQTVDGHELLRVLAAGGMGEVYLARHLRLGVERAIKVIHENQRTNETAAHRFTREAQVLSRLQHNSIVQIVEFGELPNGWPFLVMEYVEGPNLDQVISGLGPLALHDALLVLEQIANALSYAHRKNVVHRDLKPANVLLRGGDVRQVKVIDFGLAHTVSAEALSRLTAEGQILGSPLYMAPEQADGSLEVTAAVDAYSLAGVAYTLISGRPVFTGRTMLELICAHTTEIPERLSARSPEIPRLFDELMFACLDKRAAARPHVDELASHLSRLRAETDKATGSKIGNSASADARKGTMVRPVVSARGVADSELVRLLETAPPDDGVSEPLLNQLIALVSDIATALSEQEPDLAHLLEETRRSVGDLTDLEMEIAMLDARLEDAPEAERIALAREKASLGDRATALRHQVIEAQHRLAAKVETLRAVGQDQAAALFNDVDDVVAQLRSISRSAT